jgi:hypothetical protein
MRGLQQANGSFRPHTGDCESDMRFLYCACAVSDPPSPRLGRYVLTFDMWHDVATCCDRQVSYILDDWSGIDCDLAERYVLNCVSYDGGRTCAQSAYRILSRICEAPIFAGARTAHRDAEKAGLGRTVLHWHPWPSSEHAKLHAC